jgi:hypothetical protein
MEEIKQYQNTFKFFIDSTNGTSRQAGEGHTNFSVNIINHEKSGIDNCKVRLRKVFLPPSSIEGPTGDTCLFLDCNFLKPNQYRTGFSSMTNTTLSTFSTRQNLQHINTLTDFSSLAAGGTNQFLKCDDDGEIFLDDTDPLGGGATAASAVGVPKQKGLIGETISDDWIACENPFGKQLTFKIFDMNHTTIYNAGNNNAERTIIELEFQLLEHNC